MRVAVTGGTGFLGRHLLAALVERGDEVAALVRSPAKAEGVRLRGCRVVEGALEDGAARARLLSGAGVVYHVGGLVAAPSLAAFRRVNRDGTALLARDAAAAGVARFLLVSSLPVTGPSPRGRSLDEASGPGPVTQYGHSKREGETAARASGVPLTIVRPPGVYGPGDPAFLTLFRLVATSGVFPLLGDGRQELSLVFAPDLARALVAAATSSATLGGTIIEKPQDKRLHLCGPRRVRQFPKALSAAGHSLTCLECRRLMRNCMIWRTKPSRLCASVPPRRRAGMPLPVWRMRSLPLHPRLIQALGKTGSIPAAPLPLTR